MAPLSDNEIRDLAIATPHFAFPFRLVGTSFAVNEQDTDDDLLACVEAIVRTPRGTSLDDPDFGVTPQEFAEGGVNLELLRAEIIESEPRAELLFEQDPDLLAELQAQVTIHVGGAGA